MLVGLDLRRGHVESVTGTERRLEELRERLLRLPRDALELERVEPDLVPELRRGDLETLAVPRPDLAHAHERELVPDLDRLVATGRLAVVVEPTLGAAVRLHLAPVPRYVMAAGCGRGL